MRWNVSRHRYRRVVDGIYTLLRCKQSVCCSFSFRVCGYPVEMVNGCRIKYVITRIPRHTTENSGFSSIAFISVSITFHLLILLASKTLPTMASISPVKVAGTVAAVAVSGFLGYAVYFDYMRRHSPEFRKSLREFSLTFQNCCCDMGMEI